MAMIMAMANAAPRPVKRPRGSRPRLHIWRLGRRQPALAGLAVVGLLATAQVSVAEVFDTSRPQLALKAAPFDAEARSRLASALNDGGEKSVARALALDAIGRDPVQPAALREIVESGDSRREIGESKAMALMLQSQRLSRRDLPTQLWLIDYYGRHADAASAIHHFDLALRVSDAARARIFPLLEASASDPQARPLILSMLASKANWTKPFASFLMESGRDLGFDEAAARLLLDRRKSEDVQQYRMLVARLVQADRYETAWNAYITQGLGRGTDRANALRNGDFEGLEDGTPFDWTYAQEPDLWAARERSDLTTGFVLSLAASNGRAGEVARQIIHLGPGTHRLQVQFGAIPDRQDERPELRVECLGRDARVLLSFVPQEGGLTPHSQTSAFVIPDRCPFQRIAIRVAGSGPQKDPLPWVDNIAIG